MAITFSANEDRIPAPHRAVIENIIRQAIQATRPETEHWTVTTHEPVDSVVRSYDFARDAESVHSLTLAGPPDVDETRLFKAVSHFLRTNWPGGRPDANLL
jgi:hypothetical protein